MFFYNSILLLGCLGLGQVSQLFIKLAASIAREHKFTCFFTLKLSVYRMNFVILFCHVQFQVL